MVCVAALLAACDDRPAEPPSTAVEPSVARNESSGAIPCTELAASWGSGLARPRSTGGFDTSDCRAIGGARVERVRPAERDPDRHGDARCNDGTPFAFDVDLAPEPTDEWLIWLMGGGFCDDLAFPCADRRAVLVSGPGGGDRDLVEPRSERGVFSRAAHNPLRGTNHVVAHYCSSDAWSGAGVERRPTSASPGGWYFSGRINVRAMFEVLIERYGLDDAAGGTRVLYAGSSAGGAGVQATAGLVAELLPRTAVDGRLRLVNDGGWVVNFDDPGYRPGEADRPPEEIAAAAYEFWGARQVEACERAQIDGGRHPGRCFLGAVAYPFVAGDEGLRLPLLVQQAALDAFGISVHGIVDPEDPADRAALERWREVTLRELRPVEWLFSGGAQPYHTLLTSRAGLSRGPVGASFEELLGRFWRGERPERVVFGNP